MDPKSRDSQGRAVLAGKAFFTALLAVSFAAGCDAESDADVTHDDTTDEAKSSDAVRTSFGRIATTDSPRQMRPAMRALIGSAAADDTAPIRQTIAGDDVPDGGAPDDGSDDDGSDDDGSADDGSADDGPACTEGADVTAPAATGRLVVIAADESGMEPISPADCVEVVDDCDADPIVELLWATSDEPASGVAADDRSPDVSDLGCGLGVRAETAANGDGRVYTIGFRAVDRAGNATQGLCSVVVESASGMTPVDSGESYEIDLRGLGCP